jgi:hypothetical protein
MREGDFRASSFLDHRIHRSDSNNFDWNLAEFINVAKTLPVDPCSRYIFHISHVGSTLISKVIGHAPEILSLREPLVLRWLADLYNELDKPESRVGASEFDDCLAACLVFLSRKFRPENEVVIKATSFTNVLAQRILRQPHQPCALFVYSGLHAFLATILKAVWGQDDVINQGPSRLRRLHGLIGADAWALHTMSIGQLTSMSWVCEMLTLDAAAREHGAKVSWVDFDAYLDADSSVQIQLFAQLNLPCLDDAADRIASSGVMDTYSKDASQRYGAVQRKNDIRVVLEREAAEIAKATAWFEDAARRFPAIAALAVRARL